LWEGVPSNLSTGSAAILMLAFAFLSYPFLCQYLNRYASEVLTYEGQSFFGSLVLDLNIYVNINGALVPLLIACGCSIHNL
jgi:hypothetical protein